MRVLTKQHRILAYRIVDEILSRGIPAVVIRHQLEQDGDHTPVEKEMIIARASYILENLREDAKDLWKEG